MEINLEKSIFITVIRKRKVLKLSCCANKAFLAETAPLRCLGLSITNILHWHIDYIKANASRKLAFLRRALKSSTPALRFLACKTVVDSLVDYAFIIWNSFTKAHIDKLEKIQKRLSALYITVLYVIQ